MTQNWESPEPDPNAVKPGDKDKDKKGPKPGEKPSPQDIVKKTGGKKPPG